MANPTKEDALDGLDNPMPNILESKGITGNYLADKLKEELEAKETKVFNSQGIVIYSNDLITWKTRQEARKDAHKLRGDYPSEKQDLTHHIDQNIMSMMVELVQKEKKETKKSQTPSNDE